MISNSFLKSFTMMILKSLKTLLNDVIKKVIKNVKKRLQYRFLSDGTKKF